MVFLSAASIYNHICQRKGEQSFAYERNQELRLLHDALYPFLHSTRHQFPFFVTNGLVFKMEFFPRTSLPVLCLLFLIWGHLQIALAFLFSVIFNKIRTALVMSCVIINSDVIINTSRFSLRHQSLTWRGLLLHFTAVNEASLAMSILWQESGRVINCFWL